MRNSLLLFTFFLYLNSYAQLRFDYPVKNIEPVKLVASYSLKYQQDSLNKNFIKQEDMLLFIGHNTSKFTSENKYVFDTIMKKISSLAEFKAFLNDPVRPLPMTAYQFVILKNYPKGKITCFDHIIGGSFEYEENLNLFKWHLTGDTATIKGYKVQKATCYFGGRKWFAWFTPEIPYSDGPYKFNGLPGLIIKVYDTRNHYVFELESIVKPKKEIMIDFVEKDYIETTKSDFFKARDDFRNDIINRAKDAGLNSKEQQQAAWNMSQRNNPIELKRK